MKYEPPSFEKGMPVFPLEWQVWLKSPPTGDLVFDDVHRQSLFCWMMGEFHQAHEFWEQLWRGQDTDSAMRRALQGLIRVCAAGVKGTQGNRVGYFHHLRGAQEHLAKALTLGIESDWPGPNWGEMVAWLQVVSSSEKNMQG